MKREPITKPCLECKRDFTTTDGRKLFCSGPCKTAKQNRKGNAKAKQQRAERPRQARGGSTTRQWRNDAATVIIVSNAPGTPEGEDWPEGRAAFTRREFREMVKLGCVHPGTVVDVNGRRMMVSGRGLVGVG
jgi:hypothetical protein